MPERKRADFQKNFDPGSSRTKQSFREECDINKIMKKWNRTGAITHIARVLPEYGDFTTALDYQAAINALDSAKAAFAALPSEIRARMDNDPGALLDFLQDSDNLEEARELGLVNPKQTIDEAKAEGPTEPNEALPEPGIQGGE